jgi:hypothetical protein
VVEGEAVGQAQRMIRQLVRLRGIGVHHLLHAPVRRHAAPRPERRLRRPAAAALRLAHAVHHVEHVQQLGRRRHRPVHAAAALLQALERDDPARQVDLLRGEGQRFRDPAASRMQHVTLMRLKPLSDKTHAAADAPALTLDCEGAQPEHHPRLRSGASSSDTVAACWPLTAPAKVLA